MIDLPLTTRATVNHSSAALQKRRPKIRRDSTPAVTMGEMRETADDRTSGHIFPDYRGGSLVNLMASIMTACDGAASDVEPTYPEASLLPASRLAERPKLVLFIIDGLGYDFLAREGGGGVLLEHLRGRADLGVPLDYRERRHHFPDRARAAAARGDRLVHVARGAGLGHCGAALPAAGKPNHIPRTGRSTFDFRQHLFVRPDTDRVSHRVSATP